MTQKEINTLLKALANQSISKEDYRRLELAALDDPFLFDALEGYTLYGEGSTNTLLRRIDDRVSQRSSKRKMIWVPMAAILLIGMMGLLWIYNDNGVEPADMQIVSNDLKDEKIDRRDLQDKIALTDVEEVEESESATAISAPLINKTEGRKSKPVEAKKQKTPSENESQIANIEPTVNRTDEVIPIATLSLEDIVGLDVSETSGFEGEEKVNYEVDISTNTKSNQDTAGELGMDDVDLSSPSAEVYKAKKLQKVKDQPTEMVSLSGVIADETGDPLIGANVFILDQEGNEYGGVTDIDGQFDIQVPFNSIELRVNYIGYVEEVVDLSDRNKEIPLQIILEQGAVLDEVVVTEYKRPKDWESFDDSIRIGLRQYLFMRGIKESYVVEYSFRYTLFGKIKNVKIENSLLEIEPSEVQQWIENAKKYIPVRKGQTIKRSVQG